MPSKPTARTSSKPDKTSIKSESRSNTKTRQNLSNATNSNLSAKSITGNNTKHSTKTKTALDEKETLKTRSSNKTSSKLSTKTPSSKRDLDDVAKKNSLNAGRARPGITEKPSKLAGQGQSNKNRDSSTRSKNPGSVKEVSKSSSVRKENVKKDHQPPEKPKKPLKSEDTKRKTGLVVKESTGSHDRSQSSHKKSDSKTTRKEEKHQSKEMKIISEKEKTKKDHKEIILKETDADGEAKLSSAPEQLLPVGDPSNNSLESGISVTSPNDLSDECDIEESISSRFVEVDETEMTVDESSSSVLPQPPPQVEIDKQDEQEPDYEEDFENYESDFDDDEEEEEETEEDEEDDESNDSSEEEEVECEPDIDPHMESVLKALEDENRRLSPSTRELAATVEATVVSEPQDDTHYTEKVPIDRPSRPKSSRAYVNFKKAKERAKSDKNSERLRNRGQILQDMITLDSVFIDLFTQMSESYEAYIAAFGRSNSVQVSIQTNEDALTEAVQTDSTLLLDKWTQRPINVAVTGDNLPTPQDYLGVGGDMAMTPTDAYHSYSAVASHSHTMTKFLAAAGQVILILLEEETVLRKESSAISNGEESHGFSSPGVKLGTEMEPLLGGRSCPLVHFCPSDPRILITGHGFIDFNNNEGVLTAQDENEQLLGSEMAESGALLCTWNVHQPSFPQRILTCRSPPSVASYSPGRPTVVVAGLEDGSLAAWDLRESPASHPISICLGKTRWKLSPPSYITACSTDDVYEGGRIVALETVERPREDMTISYGSFQVVSLSALGQLTWWVLVQEELRPTRILDPNNPGISAELGASPWSRITLSRTASTTVIINPMLQSEEFINGPNLCFDLKLSGIDPSQLYVASANGNIVNCSRHAIKMHPPYYVPEIEPGTEAVSIAVCPHDPHYFLVGGTDGLLRLHCASSSTPLTCWQASLNAAPIKKVSWSPSRPCVFYMLDVAGMLHIWDLSAGDIYPVVSVKEGNLVGGHLHNFAIAPSASDGNQSLHTAFVSDSGSLVIRTVSPQFIRKSEEEYRNELERFRCYANII